MRIKRWTARARQKGRVTFAADVCQYFPLESFCKIFPPSLEYNHGCNFVLPWSLRLSPGWRPGRFPRSPNSIILPSKGLSEWELKTPKVLVPQLRALPLCSPASTLLWLFSFETLLECYQALKYKHGLSYSYFWKAAFDSLWTQVTNEGNGLH